MFTKDISQQTLTLLKKLCDDFQSLTAQFNEKAQGDDLKIMVHLPTGASQSGTFHWQQQSRLIAANSYWSISVQAKDHTVRIFLIPSVYWLELPKHETKENLRFEVKVAGSSD